MRLSSLAEPIAVTTGALVLTVALTYPLAFKLDRVGRLDSGDGQWNIWVVSWVARALVLNPRHVFDTNIFYPHRNTLAFSESNLGTGFLAIPAYWLTNSPYAAHNSVVLMGFTSTAIAAYYLARYLTADRRAASVAAIAFAFSPYMFARLANFHLLMTAGFPLALLTVHRFVDRQTTGRAVAIGLVLVAQALMSGYYGIFAGLMVGLGVLFYAVSRGLWRSGRYWLGVTGAAALSVSLTWLIFRPYFETQAAGFVRTIEGSQQYSADWRAYLASSAWAHRWMLDLIDHWKEVLFPGLVATGFGLAGLWVGLGPSATNGSKNPDLAAAVTREGSPRPRESALFYGLLGLLACWTSFGPSGGLYTVLYHAVPVLSLLRAPARAGILVVLALSILTSFTVARLVRGRSPRAANAIAGGLAFLTALELAAIPLRQREVPPVAQAYRTLALLQRGPVVELPFFYLPMEYYRHSYYMLNSTAHWQPLINGYSDYIPEDFREMVLPMSSFPTRESFRILEELRARYAIFHLDLYDHRSREKLLARIDQYGEFLRPIVRAGEVWLYEIVAWPD